MSKEKVQEQEEKKAEEKASQAEAKENQEEKEQQQAEEQEGKQEDADMSKEEELEIQLAEMKDKYLRLYSEFENFRRRTSKEKLEFMETANRDLIKDLLPIQDDFERAEKSMAEAEDVNSVKEGVDLIQQKFYKTLEGKGLKPIEAKGEVFDPELHEAVTQIPSPTEDMKGKVIDEIEKGYFLGEKVIRYTKVVVGA